MSWPLAPARILALAAVLALLLAAMMCLVATRQPWLGLEFAAPGDRAGLKVVGIHPRSSNPQLAAGDIIVALATSEHTEPVSFDSLPAAATDISGYAGFNGFVAHHERLWRALTHERFEFVLADGRRLPGRVLAQRPFSDLSMEFWFMLSCAVTAFLIGVAIWSFRPAMMASRILLVGATGFMYATLLAAAVTTRELTLSPFWFRHGLGENNIGIEAITYSLVALLWYYPAPLARFPAAAGIALYALLVVVNEKWQLVQWPLHGFVAQYLVAFAAMLVFALLQWRRARHEALARASLQWFLLTILIIAGGVVALFFAPIAYTGKPILPTVSTYAAGPLLFLGLAFGIARYRLFDLERWWLEVWLWLGGGLLVIGIDVLLITVFHLADLLALGFALILAGWVYLPLRQWLFRRMLRPGRTRLDDHFPLLIDTLFHDGPGWSFGERWRELVNRVFIPMHLTIAPRPAGQTAIADSGLGLRVPSFDGQETYELRFREQGRRLYIPRDAKLADTLLSLTRRAAVLWQAREEGARTERHRIMRDLHDDVAARLLTLAHRMPDPDHQGLAREALTSLRQVIYALDEQPPLALADLLNELQAQLRERARDHGIEVLWQEPENLPAIQFGAREQINLTRILTEAASNAIRHCSPGRFAVNVWIEGQDLHLHFCNDGAILRMEDWIAGKGTNNIRNRTRELGGEARWTTAPPLPDTAGTACCLELRIPLPAETGK